MGGKPNKLKREDHTTISEINLTFFGTGGVGGKSAFIERIVNRRQQRRQTGEGSVEVKVKVFFAYFSDRYNILDRAAEDDEVAAYAGSDKLFKCK